MRSSVVSYTLRPRTCCSCRWRFLAIPYMIRTQFLGWSVCLSKPSNSLVSLLAIPHMIRTWTNGRNGAIVELGRRFGLGQALTDFCKITIGRCGDSTSLAGKIEASSTPKFQKGFGMKSSENPSAYIYDSKRDSQQKTIHIDAISTAIVQHPFGLKKLFVCT